MTGNHGKTLFLHQEYIINISVVIQLNFSSGIYTWFSQNSFKEELARTNNMLIY